MRSESCYGNITQFFKVTVIIHLFNNRLNNLLADNSNTSSYSLLKAKNWKQWVADGFGFVS